MERRNGDSRRSTGRRRSAALRRAGGGQDGAGQPGAKIPRVCSPPAGNTFCRRRRLACIFTGVNNLAGRGAGHSSLSGGFPGDDNLSGDSLVPCHGRNTRGLAGSNTSRDNRHDRIQTDTTGRALLYQAR
jgi:hypothetical protein